MALQWHCNGTAMALQWHCNGTAGRPRTATAHSTWHTAHTPQQHTVTVHPTSTSHINGIQPQHTAQHTARRPTGTRPVPVHRAALAERVLWVSTGVVRGLVDGLVHGLWAPEAPIRAQQPDKTTGQNNRTTGHIPDADTQVSAESNTKPDARPPISTPIARRAKPSSAMHADHAIRHCSSNDVGASMHGRVGGWVGASERSNRGSINNDVDAIVLHALRVLVHGLLLHERGRHLDVLPRDLRMRVQAHPVGERHRLRMLRVLRRPAWSPPGWAQQQRRRKHANQHVHHNHPRGREPASRAAGRAARAADHARFPTQAVMAVVGAGEDWGVAMMPRSFYRAGSAGRAVTGRAGSTAAQAAGTAGTAATTAGRTRSWRWAVAAASTAGCRCLTR